MNTSVHIENYIDNLFYNGDELSMELYFVKNAAFPIGMTLLYVLVCKLFGPKIMENKKPQDLRTSMIIYDFIMVLLNAYMVYRIIVILSRFGLRGICLTAQTLQNELEERTRVEVIDLAYHIFLLKFVEMIDTVMFIARKKFNQVSNLHVFHHSSVPLLVLLSLRSQKRMGLIVYGMVNCFSHVVMYSYYGLSAMGVAVPWKPYVTMVQIVQFIIMIPYMFLIRASGCEVSTSSVVIYIAHSILMLKLFVDFYKRSFKSAGSKEVVEEVMAKGVDNQINGFSSGVTTGAIKRRN